MTLTSRGFHEKTGRFECLWSLFAALDYAVGSRGRVVMRMQVCVSNTKNRFFFLIGSSVRVFVCVRVRVCMCVCVCVCVCFWTLDRCTSRRVQAHGVRRLLLFIEGLHG